MIKFSEEWDKLKKENRKKGKMFTTIRGYEPRKDAYYRSRTGMTEDVLLKGEVIGQGKLLYLSYDWFFNLPLDFIQKDIHKNISYNEAGELMKKFYRMTNPFVIILHYVWE